MIRAIYLLFGLFLVIAGLDNAHKLWLVATRENQFFETKAVIKEVIKHANPIRGDGASQAVPFLAEVKFSYSVNGERGGIRR